MENTNARRYYEDTEQNYPASTRVARTVNMDERETRSEALPPPARITPFSGVPKVGRLFSFHKGVPLDFIHNWSYLILQRTLLRNWSIVSARQCNGTMSELIREFLPTSKV
jgi:hypothetical protein